jgi:hypothetical protein
MSAGPNLRTFLLTDRSIVAAVGTRVHQQKVPETPATIYIWYARAGSDAERTLDQATGTQPFQLDYDVEVIGQTLSEVEAVSEYITALDCSRGTFGSGTIQLLAVDSAGDDYVPRGLYADEGLFINAFRFSLYGYKE